MKIEDYVGLTAKSATDSEIAKFEQDYNLTIPEQYKTLLRRCWGITFGDKPQFVAT